MFKRRWSVTALALIASLSLSSIPAMANPGNGGGNGGNHGNRGNAGIYGNSDKHNKGNVNAGKGKAAKENHENLVSVNVSYDFVRPLAVNYGLTGYQALPPGIVKNLARGKPLPPGIAKRTLPASMLGQLPSYTGYEWRVVGNDLVLVALSTAIVASIINDVFN